MKVQGETRPITFMISHRTQTKFQFDAQTEMPQKEKSDNRVDDNKQSILFLEVLLDGSGRSR